MLIYVYASVSGFCTNSKLFVSISTIFISIDVHVKRKKEQQTHSHMCSIKYVRLVCSRMFHQNEFITQKKHTPISPCTIVTLRAVVVVYSYCCVAIFRFVSFSSIKSFLFRFVFFCSFMHSHSHGVW